MKLKLIVLIIVFFGWSVEAYPKSRGQQFISPSKATCSKYGEHWNNNFGVCTASWRSAKKVCKASGGRIPTKREIQRLIRSCGGVDASAIKDTMYRLKNINSYSYSSCYKRKGIPGGPKSYWTATKYSVMPNEYRVTAEIYAGDFRYCNYRLRDSSAVICVR